jgi:peptide/nickel transport system substrate-binding protein
MKMQHKAFAVFSVMIILSMVLAACAQPTPSTVIQTVEVPGETVVETQVVEQKVVETQVVEKVVEVTPTPVPSTRTGAWVDQVVLTSIDDANSAVSQLQAGELDVYAYTVNNTEVYKTVQDDPNLADVKSFGSYTEITYNPAVCTDTNMLNPFSNAKIREATNLLYDRNYIVQEIYGGLAATKLFPLVSAFPDYAKYIATARELEAKYAYNPEQAKETITTEMEAMGATLDADGKWQYQGAPVTLIGLIRSEDERTQIGDYVATQLESVGFTVDRQIKTRSEASPIWVQGNPTDCLFNFYTGGWITTAISRDDASNFSFFYTANDYPIPLFQAYTPTPEFDELALKLRNNDFTTLEERDQLFQQAMAMALSDPGAGSVRVWLADATSFSPMSSDVQVTYDLAGAIAGAEMWPLTVRFKGQEGGVMRMAQPGILVDPWNPVAGSNWIYDSMPIRATQDRGLITDPYTGLYWPQRIEKADVVVEEGLPVGKTLDWVNLSFEPTIEVPGDAWVDWDAANQKFITAAEAYTTTQTAKTKTTVTFPADLFQTVKWHDGSPLTVADFVMNMILAFDQGKPESAIFDEAAAENLAAFMDHFKGVKIVSTDPLTIETYDDLFYLDAESIVGNQVPNASWWPNYAYGPGAWHNLALGIQADSDKKLAFSSDKAEKEKVDWMSYVAGPSLEILKGYLDQDATDGYVPYAPTLGQYITSDEAMARYANLQNWYGERNNFWLGTGPFYLYRVFPVEQTITLQRNPDFPDMADRWAGFGEPKLATTAIDGPGQVDAGSEATYDVYVTFNDQPYPADEITGVKYLVFDANSNLAAQGDAAPVADGQYQVVLGSDVTSNFTSGGYKLEVAVTVSPVSIPSFANLEFVVP